METVEVVRQSPTKLVVVKAGGSKMFVNGAARCLDRAIVDGRIRFVIESDSTRPQLIVVSEQDTPSVEVLDSLPRQSSPDVVRELVASATPPEPLVPTAGGIVVDGSVLTVHAAEDRADFVIDSEQLPTVTDADLAADGGDVHLMLPDRTRLHLLVAAKHVDDTQKAIAVIRATSNGATEETVSSLSTTRWQYKVVKNLTANKLEETLNGYGRAGWELVSMTGLDGVMTLTGNKLYAVLKRRL